MSTEVWRHAQQLSNAHLVHAAMPTIIAAVEALPLTDGVRASGVEIDGRPASVTLDNKIVVALVKNVLATIDNACLGMLRDAPAVSAALAAPETT